ncbi:hypothetical protein JW906_06705 [bacterium]|nr:hypothetical protein [bacterium]
MRISKWMMLAFLPVLACDTGLPGLDQLFPGPGFEKGWSWHGMPRHFTVQNLYEYINGEAELYHAYGFRELATLTYFWKHPEDTFFTVNIYDMGDSLNAFGIYSNYRYPGTPVEKIGVEALVSEFGIKFFKGPYFVDVACGDMSRKNRLAAKTVAIQLADRIAASDRLPSILSRLPSESQVPGTARYVRSGMLNQSFLKSGVEAKYSLPGGQARGFIAILDSPDEAQHALQTLKKVFADKGSDFPYASVPNQGFAVKTPHLGVGLFSVQDGFIAGVMELERPSDGLPLLRDILAVPVP